MSFLKIFKKLLVFSKKNWPEIVFIIFALGFSWWLMTSSFSYDRKTSQILVGSKVWSDFASHIPLIRSFSWGKNFPPEFPLFPGVPIRYHFLFYALVGVFERLGVPIDLALNIPSTFAFSLLLIAIYSLARILFEKRSVAILSVGFFLFNGSFSFLEFFKHRSILQILSVPDYPSFGPYDGKIVGAFWNLNIFVNQRHLALAFAWVLIIVSLFLSQIKKRKRVSDKTGLLLGIALSGLPLFHSAVFAMGIVVFGVLLFLLPKSRRPILLFLLVTFILGLPQLFLIRSGLESGAILSPGYLIANTLSLPLFLHYWIFNLGLAFFLIPLGFWLANRLAKKVFLAFFSLFILGNLFRFSPEMAANHKFFNLFLIVGNIFVAFSIYKIWKSRLIGKLIIPLLVLFLTLSGVIDLFALKNSFFYKINDNTPEIRWIKKHTSPNAIFLVEDALYHPVSLAGRHIFLGWAYFPWSLGYDVNERAKIQKKILTSTNIEEVCPLLKRYKIDYLCFRGIEDNSEDDLKFWQNNFSLVYQNKKSDFMIFYLGRCKR